MSESGESGGGGGWLKTILVLVVAIVAGIWALKLTFWLVKMLLFVGVAGAVGYLGYSFIKGKLTTDADAEGAPRQLTDEPSARPRRPGPARESEIDEALRELKELKRKRGE
jgi:hypothetical protein